MPASLSPLDNYSIADFYGDFKMANCTKFKGENEVCLCNLPAARVNAKTYFFIFFYKYYNIFFKKNQVCDRPGKALLIF